jgi:uncharacterized protein (TIGR01244 family)
MTHEPCDSLAYHQAKPCGSLLAYPIAPGVLLAGQPAPQDWARLAAAGFRTILNLRSDPARASSQALLAEAAGLRYLHLPLPAYELEPEHLETFHQRLSEARAGGVVSHCRSASRVALLWLLHRIAYDGFSRDEAEAELRAAGYDEAAMETFSFCTDDYFERADAPELAA